jgi:S1-C subfamily serine protease
MVKPATLLVKPASEESGATRFWIASGSGTVVKKLPEWGRFWVLTARHVVEGAKHVNVSVNVPGVPMTFASLVSEVKISGHDTDLALLKVHSPLLCQIVKVAKIRDKMPIVGSSLDVVGNSGGNGLRFMSPGPLAKAHPRKVNGITVWDAGYHSYPGCSGGGVWHEGELVGVVSMVLVREYGLPPTIEYGPPLLPNLGLPFEKKITPNRPHRVVLADVGLFVGAPSIELFLSGSGF